MSFSRNQTPLVQVAKSYVQQYADDKIESCHACFNALKKIKLASKLKPTVTSDSFSQLNEVIDDFPIEVSPVTRDLAGVLNALANMSDNYNAHMYFGNIIVSSLILAKSIVKPNVKARNFKLYALQTAIERANQFAKNPLDRDLLAALSDAVAEMNRTIDTEFYFFRAENTAISTVTALTAATGSGVMFVGGILLCPLNAALAVITLLTASMLFSAAGTLTINLLRPIDSEDYKISAQTLQVKQSLALLQIPNPLLTHTNHKRARLLSMALLEPQENKLFAQRETACVSRYANYVNIIDALIPTGDAAVSNQELVSNFEKLYRDDEYETVETKYYTEFMTVMTSLKNLNELIIKHEADSLYQPILLAPLKEILQHGLQLTAEIALETHDLMCQSNRKNKLIALNDTITAAITLSHAPFDQVKAQDLNSKTTAMHRIISGHYFLRKENRLVSGLIGAALTLLSLAAMAASLALLCLLVPATAPLTFIAIGCGLVTAFSLTASASIYMLGLSFDPYRPQEDSSKKICQQSTLMQSLFRPKLTEPLRTTLLESDNQQYRRDSLTM